MGNYFKKRKKTTLNIWMPGAGGDIFTQNANVTGLLTDIQNML